MASLAINFTFKYINIHVQSIKIVEVTCKETKMEHISDKVQGLGLWSNSGQNGNQIMEKKNWMKNQTNYKHHLIYTQH